LLVYHRRQRLQALGRQRLTEGGLTEDVAAATAPGRPFVRHHRVTPWLAGLLVAASLYFLAGLAPVFSATFGLIAALLGGQLEAFRVSRVTFQIEEQLADAIDLVVATLRAGAGVLGAL